jgi:hypothetical protein
VKPGDIVTVPKGAAAYWLMCDAPEGDCFPIPRYSLGWFVRL